MININRHILIALLFFLCWARVSHAQQSSNVVKYQVTYSFDTQLYTAWVIPSYSVPNANNSTSVERGATAQYTLVVPKDFVITNITDVHGTWEKNPLKLGPSNSGQDWSAYALDPTKNYYTIGKSADETNYGSFQANTPVALFTFKGTSCNGPIFPLPPTHPFINAADSNYSLNVANSFYSLSAQPSGGNQVPLEQFINILGTAADCTPVIIPLTDNGSAPATGGVAIVNVAANDSINGNPVILGAGGNAVISPVGTYPTGISLNTTTGAVAVAVGTVPGKYPIVYQLCDKIVPVTCVSVTDTITVTPVINPVTENGTVTSAAGGTAIANVTTNDLVNGVPATLGAGGNSTITPIGTYPTGISLNTTTGAVAVAIGTVPGKYPIVYQLCDKLSPITCASVTDTITVTPVINPVTENGTAPSTGGTAIANVTTNDLVNGVPATLGAGGNSTITPIGTYPTGISLNTTTGAVAVAVGTVPGKYPIVYQLCDKLSPITCASVTDTITVTPVINPVTENGTAPSTGGTAIANVTTNDLVNGVPATLGAGGNSTVSPIGTYPTGISLNTTTGAVAVAIGTVPGKYPIVYQLCDKLSPITCASVTDTITVTPVINPVTENGTAPSTGGTAIANVTTNDLVNGVPATLGAGGNSTITPIGTYPTGISLNTTTGAVAVAVGTVPGKYPIVYQLCDKLSPITCASVTDTITVTPVINPVTENGTAPSTGGTAIANVTTNDLLNGVPATLGAGGNSTITPIGTYPTGISLNTTTGAVAVAIGTVPGKYPIVYQLCDKLSPITCASVTDTITVTPVINPVTENGTSPSTGGTAIANVTTNDLVNGVPATLGAGGNSTITPIGTYPTGISLNTTTGAVAVAIGTVPGKYPIVYQLCDKLSPITCASVTDTITVTPVINPVTENGTVTSAAGGTAIANVTTNDLVNGVPATLGAGGNSVISEVGTYPTGISLNTTTGAVAVAVGTVPGKYPIVYQLCDKLSPITCASVTDTITVTPVINPVTENGTVTSAAGGTAIANVTTNDLVNGVPATLGAGGNSTITPIGTYPTGISLNTTTGAVAVAVGTVPGKYPIVYQLCDKLSPITCASVTDTITVTPVINPVTENGTAPSTGGTAIANVTTNDLVNGVPATLGAGGNSVISEVGTYPTGISLNTTTGAVAVAVGTVPGKYPIVYQLCDKLSPITCASVTDTITVTPVINPVTENGTVTSATGGTAIANVTTNDLVNGVPATLGAGGNSVISEVGTYPTGISLNTTTGAVAVAVGTVPGKYPIVYQLCDKLSPITCASVTDTITVTPVINPVTENGTAPSTGGTAIANVTTNDLVNGVPATLGAGGNSVISEVGTYPTGISLNTTTGAVAVAVGTVPGKYPIVYQLCDKLSPITCASVTDTITVTPVINPVTDSGTAPSTGGTAIANVTTNDMVNGVPATLGAGGNSTITPIGTYPTGISLNTTTGAVTVAVGTVPGKYPIVYQLCDKLSPITCVSITDTVIVGITIVANPDNMGSVVAGSPITHTILVNDQSNGLSASLSNVKFPQVTTLPTKGSVVINPDGSATYTPFVSSVGTDSFIYRICDKQDTTVCDTALVSVTIIELPLVQLLPRVYLQGSLFGIYLPDTLMRDDLRVKGLIPTQSPYPALGFSGISNSNTANSSVFSATGNNAIVDWVFVELRSSVDSLLVLDSRSAFVQRDGDIVDVDGVSAVTFSQARAGSYYVSVRHRNHLGVMSATALSLTGVARIVDFRKSSTATYNIDPSSVLNVSQVDVEQGKALWAGNALFDREVIYIGNSNDVNVIYQQVIGAVSNTFVTPYYKLKGYFTGDINMNGEVIFQGTTNDVEFIYQNVMKNHTGNTLKQNFFKIREQLPH